MTESASETVTVAPEEAGERLDRVLATRIPALSRSRLKALILDGQVTIGGADDRAIRDPASRQFRRHRRGDPAAAGAGRSRRARRSRSTSSTRTTQLIVIDKPAGLVVHPAAGHRSGTLVNALIAHCGDSLSGIGGVKRPGIVHRLDKDTTGLMVVAKTDNAHRRSPKQFAEQGRRPAGARLSRLRLGRARPAARHHRRADRPPSAARDKMAVREGGREAVTHWQVLERYQRRRRQAGGEPAGVPAGDRPHPSDPGASGRISATRSWATRPTAPASRPRSAACGPTPQAALEALGRQALHAYLLGFEHPATGENDGIRGRIAADLAHLRARSQAPLEIATCPISEH